jgi:hypothetical protein
VVRYNVEGMKMKMRKLHRKIKVNSTYSSNNLYNELLEECHTVIEKKNSRKVWGDAYNILENDCYVTIEYLQSHISWYLDENIVR